MIIPSFSVLSLMKIRLPINHDLDWFKKNYADDFVGILNADGLGNISYTKTQMVEFLEGFWKTDKSKQESFKLSDVTMRVEGNTGIISGVSHFKGIGNDGKPYDGKISVFRYLCQKRRKMDEDGRLIYSDGRKSEITQTENICLKTL